METTKKELFERIKLLSNLTHEAREIANTILRDLPESDEVFYIINDVMRGNPEEVDEQFAALEKGGWLSNIPEGEDISFPAVKFTGKGSFIEIERPVDGGTLVAYNYASDYNTHGVGLIYKTSTGDDTDLALAEVKRGELAEIHGYPTDNKNVDLMIWGNPDSEDYTQELRYDYRALCRDN